MMCFVVLSFRTKIEIVIVLIEMFFVFSLKKNSSTKVISASKSMQLEFNLTFENRLTLAIAYCHFLNSYSIFMFVFELILKRLKNMLFSIWEFDSSTLFEYVIEFDENLVKTTFWKLIFNFEKNLMHVANRRCLWN